MTLEDFIHCTPASMQHGLVSVLWKSERQGPFPPVSSLNRTEHSYFEVELVLALLYSPAQWLAVSLWQL
jgi:hypothetical protein